MSAATRIIGRGAERLPVDVALAIIPSLPRSYLERLVQSLVDHLDTEDGDPDREDATDAEDDFHITKSAIAWAADGAGCIISDSHEDDDREDDRVDWEPNLVIPSWSVEA